MVSIKEHHGGNHRFQKKHCCEPEVFAFSTFARGRHAGKMLGGLMKPRYEAWHKEGAHDQDQNIILILKHGGGSIMTDARFAVSGTEPAATTKGKLNSKD